MIARAAATGLTILGLAIVGTLGSPAAEGAAQAQPKPTLAPTPVPKPGGAAPATTAPRAGGLPLELAAPLLAGSVATLGGGLYLFRRSSKS